MLPCLEGYQAAELESGLGWGFICERVVARAFAHGRRWVHLPAAAGAITAG